MTSVSVSINGKSFSASKGTGKFEKGAITTSSNEDDYLTSDEYEELRDCSIIWKITLRIKPRGIL